ncbi:MAG: hypothetical protein ACI9SI_000247 [Polaribacter sp.]|jgi:hypothetical protein
MNKELKPTIIYVLSSISIFCCCFAGLGVLLAGPAFMIANNKLKDADGTEYGYKSMNSAKTFALVMLIINGLFLLYFLYSLATSDWDTIMEAFQEGMKNQ